MRRLKVIVFFSLFILSMGVMFAQSQGRITGKVVDENGDPLPGVSVMVKGTAVGVSTDIDGNYTLSLPSNAKQLVFSLIGAQSKEVAVANNLTVVLQSEDTALDEVIVVAYGTAKKSSFTGSASTIGTKQIENRALTSVSSAIEGNSSGVQVTSASGQPGSDVSIRIRGFGSVNASNEPLYVVDGVVFNGNLSDINPADIESISILKDGAATALYGASAGNGVVLITTKKGTEAASVNVSITQGWSRRAYNDYSRVNIWDYYPLQWEMLKNSYVTAGRTEAEAAALASAVASTTGNDGIFDKLKYNPFLGIANDAIVGTDGTLNAGATTLKWGDDLDWENAAYGTGYRQEYVVSYNSKTDKSDTYGSVGYLNDEGYMLNTGYERYSGKINYNIYPTKWFRTGINLGVGRINSNYSSSVASSSGAFSNLVSFTRYMAPYTPYTNTTKPPENI